MRHTSYIILLTDYSHSNQKLLAILQHHLPVPPLLLGFQLPGAPEFNHLPFLHDQDPIRMLQGGQPMRDGQDRAIFKLPMDGLLYILIVLHIDIRCRLVNQHNPAMLQEGPTDTKQLFLPS